MNESHATKPQNDSFDTNSSTDYDWYSYYGGYYNIPPHTITPLPMELFVNKYIYPVLAICAILANIVVVCIFARKNLRTATSVLLICLAVSDSLICMAILPKYFFLYSTDNYKTYIPFEWCKAIQNTSTFYRLMRTNSNWITVALGLQRFIIVYKPFHAKKFCTIRNSLIAVAVSCFVSLSVHLMLFISIKIEPLEVQSESPDHMNSTLPLGCYKTLPEWYVEAFPDLKRSVWMYYLISGIFSRLLPCLILVISTSLLVYTLRKRRKRFRDQGCHHEVSEKNTRTVTRCVIAIVIVFIAAESHDAIAFLIYVYELTTDQERSVLSNEADIQWDVIGIVLSLIENNLNFWIYLLMSRQFRQVLKGILCSHICERRKKLSPTEDKHTTVSFLKSSSSHSMNVAKENVKIAN